jgi:hypothetical protein
MPTTAGVSIRVPVRVETYRWAQANWGKNEILLNRSSPVLGPIAAGYFSALSMRTIRARMKRVEPTGSHVVRLKITWLNEIALAEVDDYRTFGQMLDQLAFIHRTAWLDGYTSLKKNINGAAAEYYNKMFEVDDNVNVDRIRKEGERWLQKSR